MLRVQRVEKIAAAANGAHGQTAPSAPSAPGAPRCGGGAQVAAGLPAPVAEQDLFVWFEDTSLRMQGGRRGIAGLPESLLPWPSADEPRMHVIDRRYVEGHLHLLAAVRVRCHGKLGERIASIYTAALSVGTVAWIGTGAQYESTWNETAA